jgi:hypothetical protein
VKYWDRRKQHAYYQEVLKVSREAAPGAKNMLDVGTGECEYPEWFDWIPRKVLVDRRHVPPGTNAVRVKSDFMAYRTKERFDLVTCLQVLEHLEDPASMARRLLQHGRTVVVSVPYMWAEGFCKYHVQDPVSEKKLLAWFPCAPLKTVKVTEPGSTIVRLIAVFPGYVR